MPSIFIFSITSRLVLAGSVGLNSIFSLVFCKEWLYLVLILCLRTILITNGSSFYMDKKITTRKNIFDKKKSLCMDWINFLVTLQLGTILITTLHSLVFLHTKDKFEMKNIFVLDSFRLFIQIVTTNILSDKEYFVK